LEKAKAIAQQMAAYYHSKSLYSRRVNILGPTVIKFLVILKIKKLIFTNIGIKIWIRTNLNIKKLIAILYLKK
jgi:hypothetical protein